MLNETRSSDHKRLRHDDDWRDAAACRGMHPDVFADGEDAQRADEEWEQARVVCAECSVVEECLAEADRSYWMFAGGITPLERLINDYPDRFDHLDSRRRMHLYRRLLDRKRGAGISDAPDS